MKKMLIIFILLVSHLSFAQILPSEESESYFNDGIHFEHDPSHFKTRFRFRMQGRMTYQTEDAEKLSPEIIDFNIRRMRLRLDGTVADPRLLYRIQLSFTRGDMDFDRTEYPNILRDAVVGWRLQPTTTIWYGQTKLPGNRQRVVSSGAQQFVDRSLLNATFNIDRDLGAQLHHRVGEEKPLWVKLAISNGDGRATDNKNDGLAYTGRVEWLPLGAFTDEGDYFEADLAREPSPKFSIGAVYSLNKKTTRPGGQLGKQFTNPDLNVDMETTFIDALLKFRGFSWSSEFANRWTQNPVLNDSGNIVTVYKGQGFNTQVGYVFENNIEPALRYTQIKADRDALTGTVNDEKQYTLALSKYIDGHTIKVQTDLSYNEQLNRVQNTYASSWLYRLQVEIGI